MANNRKQGAVLRYIAAALGAGGRLALAGIFALASRLAFDIELHGLGYDPHLPHTYLAISHKRDLDAIAPLTPILRHRGWHALAGDVHFAMRSDSLEVGFLARIVARPRWLAWLLRPLVLDGILRGLGVHPLTDYHLRPAETWIRELLRAEGDTSVGTVLAPRFVREVAKAANEHPDAIVSVPLSRLLTWRYHAALQPYWGPEIFIGPARRRAARRVIAQAKAQAADLAAWLQRGGSLYGAPEGKLSPDGTISPISSGLRRMLRAAPPDTRIVPVIIVYDFMTAQRRRILVDLAPPIEQAPALSPHELQMQLRQAWLSAARFACTQLASGFLVARSREPSPAFTLDELSKAIATQAAELASAGRHVDARLLAPATAKRCAAGFLRYAARRGIVHQVGPQTWQPIVGEMHLTVRPGDVGYDVAPLTYAWNELSEMLGS